MIYGQLAHAETYAALGERFQQAFRFLKENDFTGMEDQRIEIDGDKVYAILQSYDTKPAAEMTPEAHHRYIDLQYLLEGEELVYCAFLSEMKDEAKPYDPNRDIVFYQSTEVQPLKLGNGTFLLLWPEDVHAPCISVDQKAPVRKVVIKILLA